VFLAEKKIKKEELQLFRRIFFFSTQIIKRKESSSDKNEDDLSSIASITIILNTYLLLS
jgi:hypothetical protein